MIHRLTIVPRVVAVLGLVVLSVGPAPAASPSTADLAALRDFRLTDEFFMSYEAFQEDVAKDPCALSPIVAMQKGEGKGLGEMVAAYDAQPGVHAALERRGLTARKVVLGMATLMRAAMQEAGGKATGPNSVSAENMAFYRAHKQEFHEHQAKLGRDMLKSNGGKLPACMHSGG